MKAGDAAGSVPLKSFCVTVLSAYEKKWLFIPQIISKHILHPKHFASRYGKNKEQSRHSSSSIKLIV